MDQAVFNGWTWGQAAEVALSGMLTALTIMAFMVIILRLLQIMSAKVDANQAGAEADELPALPVEDTPQEESAPGPRLAAAVSAAVYSYMTEKAPAYKAGRIKVTRGRPDYGAVSAWRMAGRRDLLQNRVELEEIRRKKRREKI